MALARWAIVNREPRAPADGWLRSPELVFRVLCAGSLRVRTTRDRRGDAQSQWLLDGPQRGVNGGGGWTGRTCEPLTLSPVCPDDKSRPQLQVPGVCSQNQRFQRSQPCDQLFKPILESNHVVSIITYTHALRSPRSHEDDLCPSAKWLLLLLLGSSVLKRKQGFQDETPRND